MSVVVGTLQWLSKITTVEKYFFFFHVVRAYGWITRVCFVVKMYMFKMR